MYAAFPAKDHAENSARACLKDLIRQFQDGVFWSAVNKRSSESITDYHDYRTDRNADTRRKNGVLFHNVVRKDGNYDRLQPVYRKRNEHRQRIKQQVADERADTSDHKRCKRVKDYCGKADDDIVVTLLLDNIHLFDKETEETLIN